MENINLKAFLRRTIMEPINGWLTHSPKLGYWRELEKTQYLPEAKLREIQWQRLREILRFVWKNNQFYHRRFQEARVSPEEIRTPEDLRRLPVLTKTEIRGNTAAMISKGFRMENLQKAKTGGSTGKALELYFTEECSELRNACARRHDRWAGWEPGEPIAACWGNPQLPRKVKGKLKQLMLQPFIYLDTMSVNEKSVRTFVREWRRIRPTLLFGHAHSIFIFAQCLQNLKISDLRPKGILSTSMMLIPSERKLIEAVFGVKATDRYGCEEVGLIGCECEKHEGMHINIEHLFIEFIKDDGTPSAPGERGEIVVTDLMNRAMPLIRYQVEDMGVPMNRKCSCGRGLPLMDNVTGRVADFLIKMDGTKVAGVSLIENTLTWFVGLDQMQILQQAVDHLEIRIVSGAGFTESVLIDLGTYFKIVFGANARIDFSLVDAIAPEQSGKYRFAICNVKAD